MTATADHASKTAHRRLLIAAALGVGLVARGCLLYLSPAYSLPYDHHEYVRWSIKMAEDGLATIYDAPPRESKILFRGDPHPVTLHHKESFVCNYPPLAAVLFWLQGCALSLVDPQRVSNTLSARVVFSSLSIVGDLLLAWGVFVLVCRLSSARAAGVAFAVTMIAPPLMIDSAFWGQTDSWLLAPAVWMLAALAGGRWLSAGVLWGLAASLKTQGALLALVWLGALCWSSRRRHIVAGALVAAAVLAATSLPFTLHSGLAWFDKAFVENVQTKFNQTTLKAFNIWYVDLLACEDDDASALLAGIRKDWWGKGLLAIGLVASALGVHRRYPRVPLRLLAWTAAALLLIVMLPTRVHERYIVMCLPFLIALAAVRPRVWWGLAPLIAAASFQLTVYQWVGTNVAAGSWPDALAKEQAAYEQALADTPPALRHRLPARDEIPGMAWENYRRQRRPIVAYEWTLTIVSILASAATLWGVYAIPRSDPQLPREVRA